MRISPVWDFVKSPPPPPHTHTHTHKALLNSQSHPAGLILHSHPIFRAAAFLSPPPLEQPPHSLWLRRWLYLLRPLCPLAQLHWGPLTAFIHPWPSDTSHCSHTWGANLLLPDCLHALSKLKTSRCISHMPLFKSSGKQKGEQKFIVCLKWCFSYRLQQTFLK